MSENLPTGEPLLLPEPEQPSQGMQNPDGELVATIAEQPHDDYWLDETTALGHQAVTHEMSWEIDA